MHLNEHAASNVTLDTCHALQLRLEPRRNACIFRLNRHFKMSAHLCLNVYVKSSK